MTVRRAMKRRNWRTSRATHECFQELGAAAAYHHVYFQPLGDDGGLAPAVVVNVPEGLDSFDYAMAEAGEHKGAGFLHLRHSRAGRRHGSPSSERAAQAPTDHGRTG